ncbi:MAG TPA: substrate-binding domain-containing protein [Terriglobales bacterium]|nr:substrate-binding domain-containing protein [Terriglobales bacterium]
MREHHKILLRFLSLTLLLLPILSCGSAHDSGERYFLVVANLKVPYWQTAQAGFMQQAVQWKVRADFVGPDTYDPQAEREEFRKAVQAKPSGILVAPADPNLLKDDIDQAIAAGIPVLTMDSDAPTSKRLFFIGTNNYQAGFMGGKRLAKELQDKGNVVVFTMPEQNNLQERLRGYRDALASSPQIKITQVVDIKGDPRVAFDTATQLLGKEKDKVNAFVCLEAQAGKEVATVLNENGIKDKVVIAMDTDSDTLDWIKKGVIAATISQKPYTMANFGLRMLDNLYHHKVAPLDKNWREDSFAPIPAFVDTGSSLVDKANVETFQAANQSMTTNK